MGIDVRKIAAGQPVEITLDADPDKRLTGKVVQVANVGEEVKPVNQQFFKPKEN